MSRSLQWDISIAALMRFNERWSRPAVQGLLAVAVFVGATVTLTLYNLRSGGLAAPPPLGGDAVIYDSLGWELAAGRGFSLNFRDAEFMEPYARVDPAGAEWLAESAPRGTIASRPPLLPLIMAALNRTCGRQFHGIRLVNIAAMGTVAALVAWTVCRLAGPAPAVLGVVQFLVVDPRVRLASREVLTEAPACLLVAALTLLLARLIERPRVATAAIAGALCGLAMLLRTMFVLWLPVLVVLVWMAPRYRLRPAHGGTVRQSLPAHSERPPAPPMLRASATLLAVFIAAAAVVFAPWGARNCRVLGRLMPLGTQGAMELSAGHSDAAFTRWGMWHNLEETGFFTAVDRPGQSALERELARADYSWKQAADWRMAHPLQVIVLPLMKVFQEFRPHMSGDLYILAFALLGLAGVRGTIESRVWGAILLATALGIAATWSVAGRFVFPALYVLHGAAAIGVWKSVIACTGVPRAKCDGNPE